MKFDILKNFRDDENGGILAFTLIMFLTMIIGGGMAIDFINHEMRREAVQDALDRGVLAATASAKAARAKTPAEIAAAETAAIAKVRSYVTISGFDPDSMGVVVTPDFTVNSQRVDVAANFNVDTYFLRMTGIDVLAGQAASAAAISVSNIELSLVFDVSGSMDFDVYNDDGDLLGRRIDLLKPAARDFASTMLSGDKSDYTTISIVPYSGQVAIRQSMADLYPNFGANNPWHDYSNCMKFDSSDYSTTALAQNIARQQYQHFFIMGGRGGDRPNELVPWCPDHTADVMPLSNDLAEINTMLDELTPQGATNTWTGIKWGVTLLDPSTRPIISSLTTSCSGGSCEVNPIFNGRPASYSDPDTLKFLIVMSDGKNTDSRRIKYSGYNQMGTASASSQANADFWDGIDAYTAVSPIPVRVRTFGETGDTYMQSICTAAKDQGIIIFTIGVAMNDAAATQMRNCASSPGNFYLVGAAGIADAFNNITNVIQKLRLVN